MDLQVKPVQEKQKLAGMAALQVGGLLWGAWAADQDDMGSTFSTLAASLGDCSACCLTMDTACLLSP